MALGGMKGGWPWPFGVRTFTTGGDELFAKIHPWKRPSKLGCARNIHPAAGGVEPAPIKRLRDLNQKAPAPFTDQTIILPGSSARPFELPPGWQEAAHGVTRNTDVPILRIVGVGTLSNMGGEEGDTFGEALLYRLHGQGITEASIEFLCGVADKSLPMPHEPVLDDPKTRSKRGLQLTRYGDWFVISNGYQRGVISLFAIWHRHGSDGKLRNVEVSGLET